MDVRVLLDPFVDCSVVNYPLREDATRKLGYC